MVSNQPEYLGASNPEEAQRLRLQAERGFNAWTRRFMDSLGLDVVDTAFIFGAGNGDEISLVAPYAQSIIAVDIRPESRASVEAQAAAFNLRNRVTFQERDISELDIARDSVGLIQMRLVAQHLTSGQREKLFEKIPGWLAPRGVLVVEDLDLGNPQAGERLWKTEPHSEDHEQLLLAMLELYQEGKDPRMGPKLEDLCRRVSLEIIASDYYQIVTGAEEPVDTSFKAAHLGILRAVRIPITGFGFMNVEEFDTRMASFRQHLTGTAVYTPPMYQVAARKPV